MTPRTGCFVALVVAILGVAVPSVAQRTDWPREDPPPPLLRSEVIFPDYEIRTLENGLRVVYVGHHEQPAVNVQLVMRAGAANDPPGKPGVAAFVGLLLDQGTTTRSAPDIASAIDSVGGALGVGAATDLSFGNVLVMKDSFDLGLDLLADVTRRPAFEPGEIERQRQQMLSNVQVGYDDPAYVADVVFNRLVYGFHPYGMPQSGTPASISRISRDDLVAFHSTHYLPNNAVIAVVGDVTNEEAFAGVERVFGDWQRGLLTVVDDDEIPVPTSRLVVIDRPGAVQTTVRAGHAALPRAHRDFLAFDLAIKILGGEGGNRLGSVLRTARSLTYSASADLAGRQLAGDFMAKTDTRSVATSEALRLTVDEVARMGREQVHPRELQSAQDYLAGNFPITIETPNAIATQVLEAILYGLDLDDLENYPDRINAVTINDIQRVSELHLEPSQLSIVLVGDASVFVQDLTDAGFEQFEVIPVSELDLSAASLRR